MAFRFILTSILVASVLTPTPSFAHVAPRTLSIVLYDGLDNPLVLRSTYGLIARTDAAAPWRFVCPTLHGGPDAPPAAAAPDGQAWIVTGGGTRLITPRLALSPESIDSVTSAQLPKLVSVGAEAYALTREDIGSRVVRLTTTGAVDILETDTWWQDITNVDDAVLLARTSTGGSTFVRIEPDGSISSTITIDGRGLEISLYAPTADDVYAVARDETTSRFISVGATEARLLFETPFEIQGVTIAGTQTFVAIDNRIHRLDGDIASPTGDDAYTTCLQTGPAGPFACVRTELFALNDDGTTGARWFELASIEAPPLELLEGTDAVNCDIEWRDLTSEAGLDPPVMPPITKPDPQPTGGCSALHTPSSNVSLFVLLVLMASRLRRRR